jgi:hypothetical protein
VKREWSTKREEVAMRRLIDIIGDVMMLLLVTLLVPIAILVIGLPIAGAATVASVLIGRTLGIGA